jgi:hypothetical protein
MLNEDDKLQLLEDSYEIKRIVEKKWEFEENRKQELIELIENKQNNEEMRGRLIRGPSSGKDI